MKYRVCAEFIENQVHADFADVDAARAWGIDALLDGALAVNVYESGELIETMGDDGQVGNADMYNEDDIAALLTLE